MIFPDDIGPGDMSAERTVRRVSGGDGIEFEREVIGVEAGGAERDESAERVVAKEAMKDFRSGLGEMGGQVHGGY
jgi:hypothetical protein